MPKKPGARNFEIDYSRFVEDYQNIFLPDSVDFEFLMNPAIFFAQVLPAQWYCSGSPWQCMAGRQWHASGQEYFPKVVWLMIFYDLQVDGC